jgi:hypothetical protein
MPELEECGTPGAIYVQRAGLYGIPEYDDPKDAPKWCNALKNKYTRVDGLDSVPDDMLELDKNELLAMASEDIDTNEILTNILKSNGSEEADAIFTTALTDEKLNLLLIDTKQNTALPVTDVRELLYEFLCGKKDYDINRPMRETIYDVICAKYTTEIDNLNNAVIASRNMKAKKNAYKKQWNM